VHVSHDLEMHMEYVSTFCICNMTDGRTLVYVCCCMCRGMGKLEKDTMSETNGWTDERTEGMGMDGL
jgi:hypothetical protein